MEYHYLSLAYAHEGQVAWVTLNRADVHNAFNDDMIAELHQCFNRLSEAPAVRAVVLSAAGKSFCAGADLNWMKRMIDYTFAENKADAMALANMLKAINDCPKPVIARIQGNAFGGGLGLISACDMAVTSKNALFALTEVKLGLIPAVISPFVLRKIPASAAHRYFLTAERFDAKTAQQLGLVHDVVNEDSELDDWISQRIEALLANGPEAVREAKQLIHNVLNPDWDYLLDVTSSMIAERRASAEGQEGMRAFLEKRPAQWTQ